MGACPGSFPFHLGVLPPVYDGQDREARYSMSIGSHLAGLAFSHSGLGLVHALASSLGGMIDAPHGVCLAACTNIGLRYQHVTKTLQCWQLPWMVRAQGLCRAIPCKYGRIDSRL